MYMSIEEIYHNEAASTAEDSVPKRPLSTVVQPEPYDTHRFFRQLHRRALRV